MKQYILLLVLMVMGAGIHAYAEDVNPVKEGNVISGHVVEKGTENSLPYCYHIDCGNRARYGE